MPNMSVGGLVSGLDTATIISQLMQLEARPQTMLKSKVSQSEKVVTALQGLNTKLASIATKAGDLAKGMTWAATKASSTIDGLTVTSDPRTAATSMAVKVVSRAAAAVNVYTSPMAPSATATSATSLSVTYADGRAATTIAVSDGTLQGVVDAINNDSAAGLKATLVRSGGTDTNPTFQLQVSSATTGKLTEFILEDGSGNFLGGVASVKGKDAELIVDGVSHYYSSNTITDLVPGVDVTIGAGVVDGASGTISVAKDVASLSDSVKGMVDAVNAALGEIGTLTAYDATAKKSGLLGGDSLLRGVRSDLIESVSRGLGGESLATVGLEVDRYGKLTFDEETFKAAYAADPAGTVAKFAGTDATPANAKDANDPSYGFADKLKVLAERFSNATDGTVTQAIKSRQSAIRGMQDDIAAWDVRLATRQTALQRQYTALETALGKLQSQSSWLAGQLASLPQMSSGQ